MIKLTLKIYLLANLTVVIFILAMTLPSLDEFSYVLFFSLFELRLVFIYLSLVTLDELPDEWKEWINLTPIERFRRSEILFAQYLAMGGSLDPERPLTRTGGDPHSRVRALPLGGTDPGAE